MLQEVTCLGLSERAPYEYPGECNTGRASTSVTSTEKIFMLLVILSSVELTEWMASVTYLPVMNK